MDEQIMGDDAQESRDEAEGSGDLPMEIDLTRNRVQFAVPKSYAVRYAVFEAHDQSPTLAKAAALGVCYPKLQNRVKWNGKPIDYGSRVIDYLCGDEAQWPYGDVQHAGAIALAHIIRSLPEWRKVKERAGFFETEQGG